MKLNKINYQTEIKRELSENASIMKTILEDEETLNVISKIVETIVEAYNRRGKIIFMGNGGSAADSQHLACEFVSKFKKERKALTAITLTVNTSILTAIGNDYDFDQVYTRQIEAWAKPEDVVIGISTSGNSSNVVKALKKAKELGAIPIAFTGEKDSKLSEVADITFRAPSEDTPRIQEAHITVGHIICGLVEQEVC